MWRPATWPGAAPIILFNGERLARRMIEKQIGVGRRPLFLLDAEELDLLLGDDDDDAAGA